MGRLAVALAALALVPGGLASSGSYGPPRQVGTITAAALPEISGLAAARAVPGGWWVVNDSGHTPELHLLGAGGVLLASVRVRGVENGDWEEVAAAPGPGGHRHLYVGDIGDNAHERDDLAVYRVREPSRSARSAPATALPFRYPDGRHDAEALFVDPATSRIYLVTKTDPLSGERCALYRFPLPLRPGRRVTLERVGGRFGRLIAPVPFVTGAALSPDGARLAIRTYTDALEWRRRPGAPFERILGATPEPVELAAEPQGEAIAYALSGEALVTTSEQLPAPLWRLQRRG
jgi:hypothetical protein